MAQSSNLIYFLKIVTKFENLTSSINNQQASFIFKILTFRQLLSLGSIMRNIGNRLKTVSIYSDSIELKLMEGCILFTAKRTHLSAKFHLSPNNLLNSRYQMLTQLYYIMRLFNAYSFGTMHKKTTSY